MVCRTEEYLPGLASVIASSSLVISHCGAGSTFEALSFGVPLIVVPNAALMDNHQVELANHLENEGVLVSCLCLVDLAVITQCCCLPSSKKLCGFVVPDEFSSSCRSSVDPTPLWLHFSAYKRQS
jgi:UDP-N-acetylglucosamine transferase subunit ALG13